MPADLFPALDRYLESGDAEAGLNFLIDQFTASGEYGLLFEARLMKKRHELGLPLIQTHAVMDDRYQAAMVEAAREAGGLYLAAGNIERAWHFFRAISEPGPVVAAIGRLEPGDGRDGIIAIAFQEGLDPLKGLELMLRKDGMCRAITAFGMHSVAKDREQCIELLANELHLEIVARMANAIEAREGLAPTTRSLPELMNGRAWLFGEWNYYVDTSHLASILPHCMEITDKKVLALFHELCEYGKHLSPQFHPVGNAPFENQFEAYDHYILALMGIDVDEHIDYFRRKVAECDFDTVGDAPARALVKLLIGLGRPSEALNVLLHDVCEGTPYAEPLPSALQLCYQANDFARLAELARDHGDLLSYAAGSIMSGANPGTASDFVAGKTGGRG